MQVAALSEEATIGKFRRRRIEELARCQGQPGNVRPAVAFQIKGRGPTGRMITADVFRLDDQGSPLRRDLGAETGAGDAPADDDDVEITHSRPWLRIGK